MLRRTWAVMRKELIQIVRDRRTLLIVLVLPVIQLFLLGYAITIHVEHVPTVVADQSLDAASYEYVNAMVASGYFYVVDYVADQKEAIQAIDRGRAQAGIVFPPGFATRLERGEAQALLLVDGSDLFTSQSAYNAMNAIARAHATEVVIAQVERSGLIASGQNVMPVDARLRILYNPDRQDLWFLIPGVAALLLQTQTIILTSSAVVREREAGTMEQLLVTPILPGELMLGKLAPNVLITIFNMLTIVGLGRFWFGVPFQGSFWLFFGLAILYVFSGLGMGLLVSNVSQSQRQTQQLAAVLQLLGLVLGGFIFPRYTMSPPIRLLGDLFPLTHFIPIARGIITKGVGLDVLWEKVVALFVYVVVVMFLAIRSFKRSLD